MSKNADNLKTDLQHWTERDIAAWKLGIHLGLWGQSETFQTELKHVFWTNNELGNTLFDMLDSLRKLGILQYDDERDRVRWNNSFRSS